MSKPQVEAVRSFCERAANDEKMLSALQGVDTETRFLEVAQSFGYEFSGDDVREAVAGMGLDEADLEGISAAGINFDQAANQSGSIILKMAQQLVLPRQQPAGGTPGGSTGLAY